MLYLLCFIGGASVGFLVTCFMIGARNNEYYVEELEPKGGECDADR